MSIDLNHGLLVVKVEQELVVQSLDIFLRRHNTLKILILPLSARPLRRYSDGLDGLRRLGSRPLRQLLPRMDEVHTMIPSTVASSLASRMASSTPIPTPSPSMPSRAWPTSLSSNWMPICSQAFRVNCILVSIYTTARVSSTDLGVEFGILLLRSEDTNQLRRSLCELLAGDSVEEFGFEGSVNLSGGHQQSLGGSLL